MSAASSPADTTCRRATRAFWPWSATRISGTQFHFSRGEFAGAFADIGIILVLSTQLIVRNGISPTAALLPVALYLLSALRYGLPMPAQPMKAIAVVAIATGVGADEIAAAGVIVGALFLATSFTGALQRLATLVPLPVVRGIQIAVVGLLLLKLGIGNRPVIRRRQRLSGHELCNHRALLLND